MTNYSNLHFDKIQQDEIKRSLSRLASHKRLALKSMDEKRKTLISIINDTAPKRLNVALMNLVQFETNVNAEEQRSNFPRIGSPLQTIVADRKRSKVEQFEDS